MPNMISKFMDKAKPRFSFHHHHDENNNNKNNGTEHHHKMFHLNNNLAATSISTHVFGYRDDIRDNYVEPPAIAPTEYEHTNPVDINRNAPPSPTTTTNVQPLKEPNTKESNTTHYSPFYPEHLPSTPPKTPGGSFLLSNAQASADHTSPAGIDHSDVTRPQCELKLTHFKLERTLGTGSFGRVHLVQSKINNRFYALKVLKKAEIVQLKQVEHTNNERAILTRIQHPFVVNFWGSFQDSLNLYMVLDYVPGGELFSLLRKSKKFTNDIARFYAGEVLLAIAYLHSKDIIYRDLKPENVLLDAHGHVKITDFGFAKLVPDITWTLCGTPDYLAPEIIQTKGYSKAADYWAFGVLVYEMLAGYPPYYDDNQFKLYEKILTTSPKYPSSIDATARDLLKHLLTTDLTHRYGNLKNGYRDITDHKWFASLDFNLLLQRKIRPPHIPHLKSEGDTSNFDKYPEEIYPYGLKQEDPYRDQFPGF
ncbi:camp-dependent protein kinase 6 [Helicostylum pulchrum]|nr:camp-dependent protein kinase 6 [Helicostylum pulchrum]